MNIVLDLYIRYSLVYVVRTTTPKLHPTLDPDMVRHTRGTTNQCGTVGKKILYACRRGEAGFASDCIIVSFLSCHRIGFSFKLYY
jgi:hypothetical protein